MYACGIYGDKAAGSLAALASGAGRTAISIQMARNVDAKTVLDAFEEVS